MQGIQAASHNASLKLAPRDKENCKSRLFYQQAGIGTLKHPLKETMVKCRLRCFSEGLPRILRGAPDSHTIVICARQKT